MNRVNTSRTRTATAPTISVIATVLNEGESIRDLMESLVAQTRQPDDVVIVDGGSTDNTVEILQSYCDKLPLQIIIAKGVNISEGRNRAIEAAHGTIIAATDAGLWLSSNWIEALYSPFLADPSVRVVGGFFKADAHSLFELVMGAAVSRLLDEIDPPTFLPGSRSIAYRKADWATIGGYPEWLDFGEDMVFVLNLKKYIPHFEFAPTAVVHFRPRTTLRAFFKQYYFYAQGDGKAAMWTQRHIARYLTYLLMIPLILLLGLTITPLFFLLYLLGMAVYLYQPYRRLWAALHEASITSPLQILRAVLLLPAIRIVGDVGKVMGYPTGVYWRWRNHPPKWRFEHISTQD